MLHQPVLAMGQMDLKMYPVFDALLKLGYPSGHEKKFKRCGKRRKNESERWMHLRPAVPMLQKRWSTSPSHAHMHITRCVLRALPSWFGFGPQSEISAMYFVFCSPRSRMTTHELNSRYDGLSRVEYLLGCIDLLSTCSPIRARSRGCQ